MASSFHEAEKFMMFFLFVFPFQFCLRCQEEGAHPSVKSAENETVRAFVSWCVHMYECVYVGMVRASRVESGEGEDSRPNIPAIRLTMHSLKLLQNSED